jgi:hypothetical protein
MRRAFHVGEEQDMSRHLQMAALIAAIASMAPATAFAQSSATTTTQRVKTGVVQSVYGNHVVVQEADGLHEYAVPEGYKFQMNGQDLTVADLKPGMKINATINEKVTIQDVVSTQVISGQVMQVAPGGFVVKDPKGELKSYNNKDAAGNDLTLVRNGQEVAFSDIKVGDRLNATIVTKYPPQKITQRSVVSDVTPAPQPPPAPAAAAPPVLAQRATLPKTGSPLPLVGLLAGIALATALVLRGAIRIRRLG